MTSKNQTPCIYEFERSSGCTRKNCPYQHLNPAHCELWAKGEYCDHTCGKEHNNFCMKHQDYLHKNKKPCPDGVKCKYSHSHKRICPHWLKGGCTYEERTGKPCVGLHPEDRKGGAIGQLPVKIQQIPVAVYDQQTQGYYQVNMTPDQYQQYQYQQQMQYQQYQYQQYLYNMQYQQYLYQQQYQQSSSMVEDSRPGETQMANPQQVETPRMEAPIPIEIPNSVDSSD